jgi:hypothetical protein
MHNLNNFVLMISLSRLKNTVNKNFNFIEIKNQNIINIQLKPCITEILKNNSQELDEEINKEINEEINEEINIIKNNSQINEQNDCESISSTEESNFLFNSFIYVADSFKFDSEDWYLIYDNTDELKNK